MHCGARWRPISGVTEWGGWLPNPPRLLAGVLPWHCSPTQGWPGTEGGSRLAWPGSEGGSRLAACAGCSRNVKAAWSRRLVVCVVQRCTCREQRGQHPWWCLELCWPMLEQPIALCCTHAALDSRYFTEAWFAGLFISKHTDCHSNHALDWWIWRTSCHLPHSCTC